MKDELKTESNVPFVCPREIRLLGFLPRMRRHAKMPATNTQEVQVSLKKKQLVRQILREAMAVGERTAPCRGNPQLLDVEKWHHWNDKCSLSVTFWISASPYQDTPLIFSIRPKPHELLLRCYSEL